MAARFGALMGDPLGQAWPPTPLGDREIGRLDWSSIQPKKRISWGDLLDSKCHITHSCVEVEFTRHLYIQEPLTKLPGPLARFGWPGRNHGSDNLWLTTANVDGVKSMPDWQL